MIESSHTDSSLALLMRDELLDTATVLGWQDVTISAYTTAVRRTVRRLGLTTVESASDVAQLEALATLEIWRSVANATAMAINYEADGGRYDREAIHKHAVAMVARLEADYSAAYPIAPEEAAMSGSLDSDVRW